MKKEYRMTVSKVIDQIGTREEQLYYIQGQGENELDCKLDAIERAERYVARYGWERYVLNLTIGDEEKERIEEVYLGD